MSAQPARRLNRRALGAEENGYIFRGYMISRIDSRRFGIVELLSTSSKIIVQNIKPIILIILSLYLPIAIIVSLISPEASLYRSENPILQSFTINIRVSNIIKVAYEALIGILVSISLSIIIEKSIIKEEINILHISKVTFAKWPDVIISGILYIFIILGLTLLFVIPGIIYSTYYSFWLYAIILRKQKGMGALSYSKTLITGQWWRIFIIYIGLGIVFYIINIPIEYLLKLISIDRIYIFTTELISQIIASITTIIYIVLFLNVDYLFHPREKRKPLQRPTRR